MGRRPMELAPRGRTYVYLLVDGGDPASPTSEAIYGFYSDEIVVVVVVVDSDEIIEIIGW